MRAERSRHCRKNEDIGVWRERIWKQGDGLVIGVKTRHKAVQARAKDSHYEVKTEDSLSPEFRKVLSQGDHNSSPLLDYVGYTARVATLHWRSSIDAAIIVK